MNLVASTLTNGASASFASRRLISVLPQPEIQYAYEFDEGYMFPRPDGILLGGTFERGEEAAETTPEAIDRIIAAHAGINAPNCAT